MDENTLPIAAWSVFIDVQNEGLFKVSATEVDFGPSRFRGLGLSFEACSESDLEMKGVQAQWKAEPLVEAEDLLPLEVRFVEETDPMGEDTVSQYLIVGTQGQQLILRHIMPPTTLGISILHPNSPTVDA
ncbi:MAG: hypothetical protein U1F26_01270 [Lysobacterales bacterium]